MKNILDYYYQMIITEDVLNKGYFSYNNHLFCLKKFIRNKTEISELLYLNNYMIKNNISINQIILNIYDEAITNYENDFYILLKIDYKNENIKNIKFHQVPNFKLDSLKRNNWSYLWSAKIDYVEYQIEHLMNKYPILYDSVNYYIGLAENAIFYFNMLSLDNVPLYINHRRMYQDSLYDPLEIIVDYKVRDISEYIKIKFIEKSMDIDEIKNLILSLNLENIDYVLLYVRMLFPSFYFDIYDQIINEDLNEEEINKIIDINDDYEYLLYEIYLMIKDKINILGIDWINKKFLM